MDKALKQRLVGASVLVALAVVVLPMLLGGAPESQQDSRPIELPPRPQELSFDTRRFPIGDQAADSPSVLPEPPPNVLDNSPPPLEQPATDEPQDDLAQVPVTGDANEIPLQDALPDPGQGEQPVMDETAPLVVPEAVAEAPAEEVVDEPVAAVTLPSAALDGRYLVQVASFSSTGNANRLAESLRGAGLPVLLDTVETSAGRLHRVRVGPAPDTGTAEAALASRKAQNTDINPRVIDLRPDETAPVSEPSDPLVRWVVQVGSFADTENAESLVFKLRDAGFKASSVAVTGAEGTAHKVRVGPVVDRQEALRLAADIRAQVGVDGLVMSAE
jgi:cell division septation protein DedD